LDEDDVVPVVRDMTPKVRPVRCKRRGWTTIMDGPGSRPSIGGSRASHEEISADISLRSLG
jgi:hypothetical protein